MFDQGFNHQMESFTKMNFVDVDSSNCRGVHDNNLCLSYFNILFLFS
jgi:hypothetical protein